MAASDFASDSDDTDAYESVKAELRSRLREGKLRQKDLAARMGISEGHLSRRIKGLLGPLLLSVDDRPKHQHPNGCSLMPIDPSERVSRRAQRHSAEAECRHPHRPACSCAAFAGEPLGMRRRWSRRSVVLVREL